MGKKYKLTDETILHNGKTLYRIEALRDFNDVKKGEKGGFIESENNLSHKGDCWVYDNAKVFDEARIYQHARVYNNAKVYGGAGVYGNAIVDINAMVYDRANISDNTYIGDYAHVYGSAYVFNRAAVTGKAKVFGYAEVSEDARILTKAEVYDYAVISGHAFIGGIARVYEKAVISNNAAIRGDSNIHGEVEVVGNAYIIDAEISKKEDYIVFKNWWSSGRYFTWTRSNNMWSVGCFYGTGEELIAKAYRDSEISGREYERIVRYVEAINQPVKHARSAKRLNFQRIVCKLFKIK